MPFPPVSILDAIVPGSTLLEPQFPSAEELLGNLPAIFSNMDVETFAERYHDVHKADARALFQRITGFIEIGLGMAGRDPTEDEYRFLRMVKTGLACGLEQLNEREARMRTLEALPTNGTAH